MEILCPKCGHKFNWERPEDMAIYKMLTSEESKEMRAQVRKRNPERYAISCPKCKAKLSIYV